MCIFVLKLYAMKRLFVFFALSLLLPLFGLAQNAELQNYKSAFETAYEAYPDIPRGVLEAISFTNTHCNNLVLVQSYFVLLSHYFIVFHMALPPWLKL